MDYYQLREAWKNAQPRDTNVGAGLPVIENLQKSAQCCDER